MIHDLIMRKSPEGGKEQGGFQDRISAPDVSKHAALLGWRGEELKPTLRADCRCRIRSTSYR